MTLRIVLYNSILFSIDSCDLLPSSQYILLNWIRSCFRLVNMCFLQFNLRSRCGPKYLASSAWRIFKPLKVIGGHIFLQVNVICIDFIPCQFNILRVFSYMYSLPLPRLSSPRVFGSIAPKAAGGKGELIHREPWKGKSLRIGLPNLTGLSVRRGCSSAEISSHVCHLFFYFILKIITSCHFAQHLVYTFDNLWKSCRVYAQWRVFYKL